MVFLSFWNTFKVADKRWNPERKEKRGGMIIKFSTVLGEFGRNLRCTAGSPKQHLGAVLGNACVPMELQRLALAVLFLAVFSLVERDGVRQFISSKSFRRPESDRHEIDKRFDYFLFVQQWPGSYCDSKRGCCFPVTGEPGPVFGIHGLWPNRNDGTYPKKCRSIAFDPNELAEMINHLHKTWGTLACKSRSNEDFWKHEWSKHGACSGLSQRRYFQASLDLYNQYDIAGALRDQGILPDDRHYPMANITNALTALLGYSPQIVCNKDPDGNQQLHEVRICVANDATTLTECPVQKICRGLVQFPVYGGVPSRHTVSTVEPQASHVAMDLRR